YPCWLDERVLRCIPGRDEHQLVRGAAGELVHRASRGTRLFAPGAGAPTGARRSGEAHSSSPIAARELDVPRKRAPPRGVAHPRYATLNHPPNHLAGCMPRICAAISAAYRSVIPAMKSITRI